MKRRFVVAAFVSALALAGASTAPAAQVHSAPVAVAKTCSVGYKHAVIGGVQKCLRVGEYCAHRYDSQYRRYGYRCIRRDYRGAYHLTRA